VAVHRLGGNIINNWSDSKSKTFLFQDFLPRCIPDSHAMAFDSSVAASLGRSQMEVTDYAKKNPAERLGG
jgi:hypothetical protein